MNANPTIFEVQEIQQPANIHRRDAESQRRSLPVPAKKLSLCVSAV
jgi:hypothetical protein